MLIVVTNSTLCELELHPKRTLSPDVHRSIHFPNLKWGHFATFHLWTLISLEPWPFKFTCFQNIDDCLILFFWIQNWSANNVFGPSCARGCLLASLWYREWKWKNLLMLSNVETQSTNGMIFRISDLIEQLKVLDQLGRGVSQMQLYQFHL